ncbi:LysM peptidoglycan-binding domain-containing protein [Prosthecobacter sp.]|uniref:L,D-transpeptidase family protein n=1 Tax=Prosthecobacter sp. TaxID=1965333 RepID=UPI003783EAC0
MKLSLLFLFCLNSASAASLHLVVKGDTLNSIARQHHCKVAALKEVNGLKSDLIRVGQSLKLPEAAVEVPAPAPPPVPAPIPSPAPAPTPNPTPPPNPAPKAPATLAEGFKKLAAADRWKIHLFLDRELFAPGKVDGLLGEFTVKAAERWLAAKKQRGLNALLQAAREQITKTQMAFTLPESAGSFVGPMPATLEEKAAAKTLLYETLAEYTAERFHTDLSTLRRLNPGLDLTTLKTGDTLQVPAVAAPFLIESWQTPGLLSQKAPKGLRLHIAYDERMLEVLCADGTLRATFPITVGAKPEHRRSGAWEIRSLVPNPTFTWDDTLLKEGRKGEKQFMLPHGPNNPVGILWMNIQPVGGPVAHIGIHGTSDPGHIGRNHSSGCVRLANWDIVRLATLVGKGTQIAWSAALPASPLAMAENH